MDYGIHVETVLHGACCAATNLEHPIWPNRELLLVHLNFYFAGCDRAHSKLVHLGLPCGRGATPDNKDLEGYVRRHADGLVRGEV